MQLLHGMHAAQSHVIVFPTCCCLSFGAICTCGIICLPPLPPTAHNSYMGAVSVGVLRYMTNSCLQLYHCHMHHNVITNSHVLFQWALPAGKTCAMCKVEDLVNLLHKSTSSGLVIEDEHTALLQKRTTLPEELEAHAGLDPKIQDIAIYHGTCALITCRWAQ
jgi:hypothetical protein